MTTGRRVRVSSGDAGEVRDAVVALQPRPDEVVAVLVAERGAPDLEALVARLNEAGITFFGGLFPHILEGARSYDRGVLAFTLPRLGEPILIRGLDTDHFEVPDCASLLSGHRGRGKPTAMVLADGLTANISRFVEAVYNQLGSTVSYWGGGAGINAHSRRPCVITRHGVHQDAAVIALAARPSRLGVGHGWREIRGPFVATRSRRNVIAQLNWENALEVYRGVVERDIPVKITPENFYEVAGSYPFALRKHDQEMLVRCAVSIGEGGALVCVGEVPENAVLSILKAEPGDLVAAAGRAAREAHAGGDTHGDVTHCLVADCVSRATLLGGRFPEELAAVSAGLGGLASACSPVGMLTLGEIASRGQGYLEYFNKTCVVAVMHAEA
jgi:hypothetical protein